MIPCYVGHKGGIATSYELDSTTERACPCGKGTYTVRVYSNDWFQYREEWEMNCPTCRLEYTLEIVRYIPPGETTATKERRWVKKKV